MVSTTHAPIAARPFTWYRVRRPVFIVTTNASMSGLASWRSLA
jgi:hypothetical protein